MKKWNCICKEFAGIHLVDRCLMVFMIVLLAQSAYRLLTRSAWTAQANEIDIIVRTSAAGIFGYFLSANFIRRDSQRGELTGQSIERGRIDEEAAGQGLSDIGSGTFQVLVATVIGLFCLITLILLRNMKDFELSEVSASAAATVTQFRDFVSGCVGFLIGCPTSENRKI